MIKVLFICHGNICRSPMAEFLLKDMVKRQNCEKQFMIASAATSSEEIGNPVHHKTKAILAAHDILTEGKTAVQLTKEDYNKYDYLIGMDTQNERWIMRIIGSDPEKKVYKLLDFTKEPGDIADPWYTGDFETTYRDIVKGLEAFLEGLKWM